MSDKGKDHSVDNNEKRVNEEERTELAEKFKEEELTDDIPMEELEIDEKSNKDKQHFRDESQSEKKYRKDRDKQD
ncbi:hypothetical protein [Salimicrobium halophilum]|uniref:Uncharacterized protein n=1 Tax=Salimicrobium halophilum TaxID=86666 RepID=A0A1G8T3E8_9BACI|nr:hypothetical protein [Salimicrobium halophilum]SDJ36169.1 hypothetical protein SAMN04490247_1689 [Salimicrobium halophilum]